MWTSPPRKARAHPDVKVALEAAEEAAAVVIAHAMISRRVIAASETAAASVTAAAVVVAPEAVIADMTAEATEVSLSFLYYAIFSDLYLLIAGYERRDDRRDDRGGRDRDERRGRDDRDDRGYGSRDRGYDRERR